MHHHYHYHLRHHITLGQPNHDSDSDTQNNNNNNNIKSNMPTDNSNSKANKTATSPPAPCQKDECVGTLLVHQADVQELSGVGSPKIVRRMTERVAKAIEHLPEQQIDPDDDILAWQCDI